MVKTISKFINLLEGISEEEKENIIDLYNQYFNTNYDITVDDQGRVSAGLYVEIKQSQLTNMTILPVTFAETRDFSIARSNLTSLIGCPRIIHGYFEMTNCSNIESLEGFPDEIDGTIYIDWKSNLPLLRLIKFKRITMDNEPKVENILMDYCSLNRSRKTTRKDIIACQKELIDAGYEGNAKW